MRTDLLHLCSRIGPAAAAAIVGIAWIATGSAQTPPPAPATFEVASVRSVPAGSGFTAISPPGASRFSAENATLSILITLAYGIDSNQLAGGPGWLDSEIYSITAKPEGDGGLTYAQLMAPLQKLLAERFHLAVHHETKEVPGYALVATSRTKLEAATAASSSNSVLPDGLQSPGLSMGTLAGMLSIPLRRPVIDKTGISGLYKVQLSYAPQGSTESPLPSIFTAVQEQLGLKLETAKVSRDMLVVDHVDKIPTEN